LILLLNEFSLGAEILLVVLASTVTIDGVLTTLVMALSGLPKITGT
jgi:hypothetical protein